MFAASYNVNVIVVEWKKCANSDSYDKVKKRLRDIGIVLATFLDFVEDFFPNQLDKTELIGHSFGAHIAGLASKHLVNRKAPAAILGLDPAGLEFSINKRNERLDKDDAQYVEVTHTDIDGIGFPEPIGDVDVYPYYGKNQPGCDTPGCNHNRAIDYFVQSITSSRKIVVEQCDDYSNIVAEKCRPTGVTIKAGGEPLNVKNPPGIYFSKYL